MREEIQANRVIVEEHGNKHVGYFLIHLQHNFPSCQVYCAKSQLQDIFDTTNDTRKFQSL